MKIVTLLPLADNHGRPFGRTCLERILDSVTEQFKGCSTDGIVDGRSIDKGVRHQDLSLRVTIVCENEQLMNVRRRVIEIGVELEQESMYFEVRDYDGVQILDVSEAAD